MAAQTPSSARRVLIVDDEPEFTLMMGHSLRASGPFEVREENDSRNTLAAVREFHPDVILLDVMMPDMDGGDVAAELASRPDTRDIPLIFLTALVGDEEAEVGGVVSGGHCFLPKPVSIAELMGRIEDICGKNTVT